jgi:hypothetical protein
MPAPAICDSTGNWWRLAADTGGSNGQILRVAMWICDSALAIPATGWLSVAVPGYVSKLDCIIAEYSGLPAGYEPVIDFSASYINNSSSAVTLTATSLQADYCFASARSFTATVTPPTSPWATAGSLPSVVYASYATYAANSSISATFSLASAQQCAGVMIGISQASYPPSNGNPNFPVVRVEAAFGASPGDSTQTILDTAWTDLTQRAITDSKVAGITVHRGRQYELATPEAGELTVMLNNLDGAFNPAWPGGAYYSNAINANMSFQSGIAPWKASNGSSLSQSSAFSFASGINAVAQYSMLMVPNGVTASPGFSDTGFDPVNVNDTYLASCWVYSPTGWATGVFTDIIWYNSSFSIISTTAGSAIPVPAATWTQITQVAATPPAGAVYAALSVFASGTPTSSVLFYFAEAAIAAGNAVLQTGLVRLQTPVRVSAYWQGQRYPVGYGYVERWPQSWPQMPQWGFSPMVATDVVGIANAVNLPSAVQGEILADEPYACFPFNEQYQTSSSTINGLVASANNASGLIAVNTSRVNQKTANYIAGDQPIETGQTISFNGDSGTGMGVTGYSGLNTANFRGSGVVYGPDTGLPVIGQSTGFLADFWVNIPAVTNTSGSVQLVPFIQFFGKPYIDSISPANLAPGWLAAIGVYFPVSGSAVTFIQLSTNASILTSGTFSFPFNGLCYVVIDVTPSGTISCIINGFGIGGNALLAGPIQTVTFGQADYSYGTAYAHTNYSLAYGSVYSYEVPAARYSNHYLAGTTGFSGDTIMQRFGRYQAWSLLNVNPAGPGGIADAFELSAAYGTDGSSFASVLNTDAQSSGALWFGNANGNLVVLPRPAIYRQPSSIVFGDNAAIVLNSGADFSQNGAGWSASGGTFAAVTSQPAGALYSFAGLLTLTSSSGLVSESAAPFTASPGASYTVSCWAYTSQSAVVLELTWLDASHVATTVSTTITVQALTWTYVSFTAAAAAGTVTAYPSVGITGASTNYIYIEHVIVIASSGEIPYEGNLELDYDNTYIQNVTQASLVQGPNSLVAPVEKNLPSISEYLTRGPQGISVNGTSAQDAYDVSYWRLNKYSQPQLRVSRVTVDAATNPLTFTQILQTDISDVGTANRRPLGAPSYSLPVITQRVEMAIGPGVWTTAYQLSPYVQEGSVLVADTSGQDVLGTSTLAW